MGQRFEVTKLQRAYRVLPVCRSDVWVRVDLARGGEGLYRKLCLTNAEGKGWQGQWGSLPGLGPFRRVKSKSTRQSKQSSYFCLLNTRMTGEQPPCLFLNVGF